MIYYLMLIGAAVLIVLSVDLDKYYQKCVVGLNNVECAIRKSIPGSLLCALLFFAIGGFKLQFSWFSFLIGIGLAVLNLCSTLVCFKAYEKGNVSLFTMFRMQGGMLLPFIYGIIFANNKPTVFQIIGIVVMVISLLFPNISFKKGERKTSVLYTLLCVVIFLINGGISIVSYIQSNSPNGVDSFSFLTLYQLENLVLFLLVYAVWCFVKKDNLMRNPPKREKKQTLLLWGCIFIVAIMNAVGYLLQLIGAANLPAVAVYPIVTGGTVVLTAVSGLLFFKEKLDIKGYIGVVMTFIATVLFVF